MRKTANPRAKAGRGAKKTPQYWRPVPEKAGRPRHAGKGGTAVFTAALDGKAAFAAHTAVIEDRTSPKKRNAAASAATEGGMLQNGYVAAQIAPGAPVIAVVGGGAAGLAAAVSAARTAGGRARVLLLEKGARVGRKLLATGGGRCNLGNTVLSERQYVSGQPAALSALLAGHTPQETPDWLAGLGLLCREEEGRLYPYCGQAAMVLDVLRAAAAAAGVQTLCGCLVRRLQPTDGGFLLTLQRENATAVGQADAAHAPAVAKAPDAAAPIEVAQTRFAAKTSDAAAPVEVLRADKVILATGGAAAPALGGSEDGYALAAQLGHGCTQLVPGLVGLRCAPAAGGGFGGGLKGIRAEGRAALYDGAQIVAQETGELQFTEEGVSGIPVLQLSLWLPGLRAPRLVLDLLPQLGADELLELLRDRRAAWNGALEDLLLGTVHRRLGWAVMKSVGLTPLSRPLAALTDGELTRLCGALKGWQLTVTGTQGWAGAQVTVGGVPLDELAGDDCASRRCAGLYLAGELLDAAGYCGGYNLDWAFTTGRRAGEAAARAALGEETGKAR